jgi:hypothetical protein
MTNRRFPRLRVASVALLILGSTMPGVPILAQPGATSAAPVRVTTQTGTTLEVPVSADVRRELINILRNYPPALGQVLKLDPTLMTNEAYLQPYPALTAFLRQHPEVLRNSSYYLAPIESGYYGGYEDPAVRVWNDMIEMVTVLLVIAGIAIALGWIIRTVVDHRRWHRIARVQSEAHAKLLDRFTANDELLAYVQSPAGNRFLTSAPVALDTGATRQPGAPLGRILWSVQAGFVLFAGGAGLAWVTGADTLDPMVVQPLYTLGVLGLALGVGFIVSAGAAYMLSRRLGLFEDPLTSMPRPDRRDVAGS